MKDSDLKARFRKWISKVGEQMAISHLTRVGISPSTAYRLVADIYESEPKNLTRMAIERAMEIEEK